MKKLNFLGLMIIVALAFTSCIGPMGPQGPVGPSGHNGYDGQDGQDGNANVASSTLTIYPSDWYWDQTSWRVDVTFDAISPNITDYGAVLVYMNNENTWRQLPMTFYYSQVDNGTEYFYSSSLEVSSYDNGVSIFWTESDFYDEYRPEQHDFKIVVIAASIYSAHSDLDYSDYNKVKEFYNLAD